MRTISLSSPIVVLMRGLPGSGKSTWLQNNDCVEYSISPDEFRLMLSPPVMLDGKLSINQKVSQQAWEMAYACLRSRLSFGGATFFDATFMNERTLKDALHVISSSNKNVKVVVLDFTFLPIEEVKRRNNLRTGTFRYVPDAVINRMWSMGRSMDLSKFDVEVCDPRNVQIVP